MTMSTVDVLLLVPLIPAMPVIFIRWLPLERWIPWGKLPKSLLGPYILYGAFAAWHFRLPWWAVDALALAGIAVSGVAILTRPQAYR